MNIIKKSASEFPEKFKFVKILQGLPGSFMESLEISLFSGDSPGISLGRVE
jgi:hypothetical protein